jgi:hypothetical protein
MKYLKRFNEELNSQTYLRASYRRKKSAEGLTGRNKENALKSAKELHDWAGKAELRESLEKWQDNVEKYAKYGKITGYVKDETINFYYNITFDSLAFSDTFDYEKEQSPNKFGVSIPLMMWLIPVTKEEVDRCLENMDDIATDYFHNGEFQAFYLSIDLDIVNDEVKFKDFNIYPEGDVGIELTPNAGFKVKEMLIKLFSDKSLNYPSSVTTYDTEYEHIEGTMCIECGLSVDYGFELNDVVEYLKTLPKQKFMQ